MWVPTNAPPRKSPARSSTSSKRSRFGRGSTGPSVRRERFEKRPTLAASSNPFEGRHPFDDFDSGRSPPARPSPPAISTGLALALAGARHSMELDKPPPPPRRARVTAMADPRMDSTTSQRRMHAHISADSKSAKSPRESAPKYEVPRKSTLVVPMPTATTAVASMHMTDETLVESYKMEEKSGSGDSSVKETMSDPSIASGSLMSSSAVSSGSELKSSKSKGKKREGPPPGPGMVRLTADDGTAFFLSLDCAKMSGLMKRRLEEAALMVMPLKRSRTSGQQLAAAKRTFVFDLIKKSTLQLVVKFMIYHFENPMEAISRPLLSVNLHSLVSNFDADFVDTIHFETLFELITAAELLEIESLLDLCCAKYASMIKTGAMGGCASIREQFDISEHGDAALTDEEKRHIEAQYRHLLSAGAHDGGSDDRAVRSSSGVAEDYDDYEYEADEDTVASSRSLSSKPPGHSI